MAREAALPYGRRISARYMGDDLAERFARRTVAGELLVRLTPDRMVAEAAVAD